MNSLNEILMCAGIGAVIGLILRGTAPDFCLSYSRYCQSPDRRNLYIGAAIFFLIGGIWSFADGSIVRGCLGLFMSALEVFALLTVMKRPSSVS